MAEIRRVAIFRLAVGANHLAPGFKCNISLCETETSVARGVEFTFGVSLCVIAKNALCDEAISIGLAAPGEIPSQKMLAMTVHPQIELHPARV